MGEDGARGKDWLRAWGHHLCLTDTIFYFFFFLQFLQREITLMTWRMKGIYSYGRGLAPEGVVFNSEGRKI